MMKKDHNTHYASHLIEVTPPDGIEPRMWYLRMKETMTRIGIPKFKKQGQHKLFQSMYILKRGDRYFLPHFKEMFVLDGRANKMTDDDYIRRNSIALLLYRWGSLRLSNKTLEKIQEDTPELMDKTTFDDIFILPYAKKSQWKLIQKYPIGIIKHKEYHSPER